MEPTKSSFSQPEILTAGKDISVVTYGANVAIALDAEFLRRFDIELEVIDVQTLLPFDKEHLIVHSLKKTNAVIFFDEDSPGASAFMMQQVLKFKKVMNISMQPLDTVCSSTAQLTAPMETISLNQIARTLS